MGSFSRNTSFNCHSACVFDSKELANFLRSGPSRPVLDRLIALAAEITGLDHVVFGIRNNSNYYFISTYGIPFSVYEDVLPVGKMSIKAFSYPIEVLDLSKEEHYHPSNAIPLTQSFRYGANAPVNIGIKLTDGGVLALSAADSRPGEKPGQVIEQLTKIAALISDSIWLMLQVRNETSPMQKKASTIGILLEALKQTHAPLAIIDSEGQITEFSPGFSAYQQMLLGFSPQSNSSVYETWLDDAAKKAVRTAIKDGTDLLECITHPENADRPIVFDFLTLNFAQGGVKIGVFSVHMKCADPNWQERNSFSDVKTPFAFEQIESKGVVSDFLINTLQKRSRFAQRTGQSYLVVRSWRKPIKPYQISALRALKRDVCPTFVAQVADELTDTVKKIYGDSVIGAVTAVPCGHSGEGCLAEQIAVAVSKNLGVPYKKMFECIPIKGSSHPKTNGRRPPMQLIDTVDCPILLVDDVATSGSHIEEAATKLREHAPAVWPIAWIAD